MKFKNIFFLFILSLIITSCGSQKKVVEASGDVVEQSVQNFWDNYQNQLPQFNGLQIKSRLNAKIDGKNINATVRLYIENEKQIWLNASVFGITGARGLFTPNRVQAYEVLDKTYIDTNYSYLNDKFKVDFFDYKKLQQILLGQLPLISSLNNYTFIINKDTGEYELAFKKNKALKNSAVQGEYIHTYFLDSNYRLNKIEIIDPKEKTEIIATYKDWILVGNKNLPSQVKIFIKTKDPSFIELEYNNFTFEETNPPFKIPKNYAERKVK